MIFCIPLPLLWTLQVPLKKKIVIGILLSSGAFVIAAAIIRVVLTTSANPSAISINSWGVRETIVGILTVNIPILRPVFNKEFWTSKKGSTAASSHALSHGTGNKPHLVSGNYELASSVDNGRFRRKRQGSDSGSQESIIGKQDPSGIAVQTTYQVSSNQESGDERSVGRWNHGRGTTEVNIQGPGPVRGDSEV